ncbi:MAG: hypothetical protein ETSY2_14795 [Candidatus Entotheonella gemina]|uniref:Uncharacterized protein n=1 Tax=Candidatus Entotheonella gemina TaxID=1429439 RepID=W4M9I4_9BACT|nr:MAG: hypothetical protein ETSY2_14795 [Candidatus Entotheonella gemina]
MAEQDKSPQSTDSPAGVGSLAQVVDWLQRYSAFISITVTVIGWLVGLGILIGQMQAIRIDIARLYDGQVRQTQVLDALSNNVAMNTEAIERLSKAIERLNDRLDRLTNKVENNTNLLSRLDERTKRLKL